MVNISNGSIPVLSLSVITLLINYQHKNMATFTATITYTCTIEVDCPDSKLKYFLEDDSRELTDYAELTFVPLPKNVTVSLDGVDIEVSDIGSIEKSNGNCYEWYDEKLTKI